MRFKETEKDFIILVNREFLINRTRELYDEDIYLITDTEYTEDGELNEDISLWMKENDKAAVLIFFSKLKRFSFQIICIKADGKRSGDYFIEKFDDTPDGIRKAINAIPEKNELLRFMRQETILKEIDYTDRCGNCHQFISPSDKYCMYCGTEKGKGQFLPFENRVYFMYGPPTSIKTKCSNCGNISLSFYLPEHKPAYCTNCGLKTATVIRTRTTWDQFGIVGMTEPFDEDHRPVLFTAEQVDRLLQERGQECEIDGGYVNINTDKVIKAMRKIGIELPEEEHVLRVYPKTEFEGEQIFLAHIILSLYGKNGGSNSQYVKCPSCGNNRIAVIVYTISKDDKGYCCAVHYPSEEHQMRSYSEYNYPFYAKEHGNSVPAYICLCCGKEFGELNYPDNDKKRYKLIKYKNRPPIYGEYDVH